MTGDYCVVHASWTIEVVSYYCLQGRQGDEARTLHFEYSAMLSSLEKRTTAGQQTAKVPCADTLREK